MTTQLDSLRAFVATRPAGRAAGARAGDGPVVIVVGSGKGGTGTSVLAALVALSAAALGRRTLLVDGDAHVGPQRLLLGVPHAPGLAALRDGATPEQLLVPISATLSLCATLGESEDPSARRALLRRLAPLFGDHDVVVLDGGSRLDAVRSALDLAGAAPNGTPTLLAVAEPDPIALAATHALVKACGAELPVHVVLNRADAEPARHAFAQLEEAARCFLQRPLRLAGVVPDDASLAVALRAGMPLQDAAVGSPAAVATHAIAEALAPAVAPPVRRGAERALDRPASAMRPAASAAYAGVAALAT